MMTLVTIREDEICMTSARRCNQSIKTTEMHEVAASRVSDFDFSGSCIDGKLGTACVGEREILLFLSRELEATSTTVWTSLFALGSMLCEIVTGEQLCCDLEDEDDTDDGICERLLVVVLLLLV